MAATNQKATPCNGIVVYLLADEDGKVRVRFDDVVSEDRATWSHLFSYTSMTFDEGRFGASDLSHEDLEKVGFGLVARLAATMPRTPNDDA
jgi:hypothetical protein